MRRKSWVSGVMAIAALAGLAAPVAAQDGLSATLDGGRLRVDRIPSYHCHDFDLPVIRCFSTAEGLAADIARRLSGSRDPALLLGGYVTVFEHSNQGGASLSLASDASSLAAYGWNDRISSFQSNGTSGTFREHSPPGGFSFGFGPTTRVDTLSATYNDKFSALDVS